MMSGKDLSAILLYFIDFISMEIYRFHPVKHGKKLKPTFQATLLERNCNTVLFALHAGKPLYDKDNMLTLARPVHIAQLLVIGNPLYYCLCLVLNFYGSTCFETLGVEQPLP